MRHWAGLLAALAIALLLTVVATTPPAPAPADAPAAGFSAERAMADIRAIAQRPHPSGSPEQARVRAVLLARLQALGLQTTTRAFPISAKGAAALKRQGGAGTPELHNIIGRLPGRDPAQPALVLMAHYDSVVGSPGAPDDAAGVAAILETVRALQAQGRPLRDVIVLLTDGEELGLEGAAAFFRTDPLARRVGVVVNAEARGGGGRTSMFETGANNGAMMRLFGEAVHRPVATSLSVFVYKLLPNNTDLTRAIEAGVPGFNFAFVGRPGLYHSPRATPDTLDRGAVQDMGRQLLDLSRALANAPALPGPEADATFFDLFGLLFFRYPPAWGWLPLAAAAGLFAWGWRGTAREGLHGAGLLVALLTGAGVLLWAGNMVSGADGPTNYYDRLAAIPLLQAQALLLCAAAVAGLLELAGDRSRPALAVGAGVVVLAMGIAAQLFAPTTAFPFAIAAVTAGAAIAARARLVGGAGVAVAAAAGGIGIGYALTLGYLLLQSVGTGSQIAALAPLALAAPILLVLTPACDRRRGLATAGVLAAAGLAVALWVRLDPVPPTVATYSRFTTALR